MDLSGLAVLIPILALSIPVLAIFFNGLHKTIRLRTEETQRRAASVSDGPDLQALADEVERQRQELAEVQERLDFTERLLARGAPSERLPPS
ncbi:MAG: hypothetical protein ACREMX_10570 [Gemmatimonadales bacterium]